MKIPKKAALPLIFSTGVLLFATTALADIVSKSGYDELKAGLKQTMASCTGKFDSFTLDYSFALKYDGNIVSSQSEVRKSDSVNSRTESVSQSLNADGGTSRSYHYSDRHTMIDGRDLGTANENYSYTEYSQEIKPVVFSNPFKEESAEDVEKIIDAVVGSLRDHVVVQENADGSKALSGSLSEVQIPALINAVASFEVKQTFSGMQRAPIQPLTQDIFVKEISGSATINQDGDMDYLLGTVILTGKDEQGEAHEMTMEVLVKLSDMNASVVAKPDLAGKKVEKRTENYSPGPEIANPEKFAGEFKNDIIIEKDGKFVKAGERILNLAHVESTNIAGSYHEEYKEGFEEYAQNKPEFTFEAAVSTGMKGEAKFTYTDSSGRKQSGTIYLDEINAKVYFNLNAPNGGSPYDSTFAPVLE